MHQLLQQRNYYNFYDFYNYYNNATITTIVTITTMQLLQLLQKCIKLLQLLQQCITNTSITTKQLFVSIFYYMFKLYTTTTAKHLYGAQPFLRN
jgi:hypothetical protein